MTASLRLITRRYVQSARLSHARAFSPHAVYATAEQQPRASPDVSRELKVEPKASVETGDARSTSPRQMTSAEADEELRRRLEDISGEGGASGVETEDGKPASIKRAVRSNMFRYI